MSAANETAAADVSDPSAPTTMPVTGRSEPPLFELLRRSSEFVMTPL
ncbi:hypothetical protein Rrhod_0848 [Rhodococcus rhodnii LMG 5362]|uniref:Uncharacterized protein n=1 Tax=Rhodococcus rhodnii LMG 5362 TaxID=1273125 RepID=R7WR57_9NOCA|nr:hypothetical protein Rrhod_0848 [Rhodococcus rhodnii LMG 5362]